ncbi:MAG: hypothetical protein JNM25_09850 [Planctomycetes bacterium]|nr:hypothetical protein [Planctomycetota bacterium]
MVEHRAWQLSELARARMGAALPGLLGAMRRRRRRRQLARAGIAVSVLIALVALWSQGGVADAEPTFPPLPVVAPPLCVQVGDDPQVVARLSVATVVRAEWFLDDAGLQRLLRGCDRPDGLVRVDRQVLVSAAAVDPFPMLSP